MGARGAGQAIDQEELMMGEGGAKYSAREGLAGEMKEGRRKRQWKGGRVGRRKRERDREVGKGTRFIERKRDEGEIESGRGN